MMNELRKDLLTVVAVFVCSLLVGTLIGVMVGQILIFYIRNY